MHLSTKQISLLGLLLAFSVVLNVLSGVIETSTLFLLAAASYFIGIAFRETNKLLGTAFYIASVLLSLILAPNKLYCITYAVIGCYIVLIELLRNLITGKNEKEHRPTYSKLFIIVKFIIFNIIYVPILIYFPKLIIAKKFDLMYGMFLFFAGQVLFFIYDKAYDYFMRNYWERYKKNFLK